MSKIKGDSFLPPNRLLLNCFLALAISWLLPALPCAQEKRAPLEPVVLQLKWKHQFQFAGYYAALEKGYYRQAGLHVTILEMERGQDVIDLVLSGLADYGVGNAEVLHDWLNGAPLVVLAAIFQHSSIELITLKDSGIATPHDLIGKRLLIGGSGEPILRAMLLHEGVSPEAVVRVPYARWSPDALTQGVCDAFGVYSINEPFHYLEAGVSLNYISPRSYGVDFYEDNLFTTEDTAREHPDRTRRFRQASLQGWRYAMSNPAEIVDLLMTKYRCGKSRAHLEFEAQAMRELILADLVEIGHMNPGRWKHMAEIFVSLGMGKERSFEGFLFDPQEESRARMRMLFVWLGIVASCAAFLLLASYAWVRLLRKAVREKTDELRKSEERFRAIFDSMPLYLALWERREEDFVLARVNPATVSLSHSKIERYLGASLHDFYEDTPWIVEAVERCFKTRTTVYEEKAYKLRSTSEEKHLSFFFAYVPDGLVMAISEDITERKEGEEALRRALEQQKAVFETSMVGIMVLHDRIITKVNRRMAEMLGYEPEEMTGKGPEQLHLSREHFVEFGEKYYWRLAEKTIVQVEYPLRHKDGHTVWCMFNGRAVAPPDMSRGAVWIIDDVTERKLDQQEREKLRAQLAQAQKLESIGRLAGGVAHDLNNVLSPILGYGEMLLAEASQTPTHRDWLQEMVHAGERGRDLVRQLLTFSRKQPLELKSVDLNSLLKNFQKLLCRTIRENITIHMTLAPSHPLVQGDVGQLEQIVMNLAVNSQDAMSQGGRLDIETGETSLDEEDATLEGLEPGRYATLSMRDTGCGMDEETREHIFEPFYSTKGEQGTGLGLATVYGIVKQHGGHVRVDSAPGKGTGFTVYLPVSEKALSPKEPRREKIDGSGGSETILLVEDNEQVRNLALAILESLGYAVLVAKNGEEALETLHRRARPVQLLLTDVVMPGMNGRELFQKVSASYPDMKVLYMSGYTDDIVAHSGVLDEGVRLIQKPFSVELLASEVREALESCDDSTE